MKNKYLDVIFTNHAINRLYNRGITQSDAWYTFKHPEGILEGKIPGSKKFYKNYGDQRIEVVVRQNEKSEWIVLSCWSKYVGNGKPLVRKENFLEKIINKGLNKLFSLIKSKKT